MIKSNTSSGTDACMVTTVTLQIGRYRAMKSGHNKSDLITYKRRGQSVIKNRFEEQNGFACSLKKAKQLLLLNAFIPEHVAASCNL